MSEVREAMKLIEFPEKLGRFAQRFSTFEEVWDECPRADWMLWLVENLQRGSKRGLRLFICNYARRWWLFLPDTRSQRAVEAAERMARGELAQGAVEFIREGAIKASMSALESSKPIMSRAARLAALAVEEDIVNAAKEASEIASQAEHAINETENYDKQMQLLEEQANLLRQLMPNPFAMAKQR